MKDHYPVFILWSEDDECFLANVVDLPGCIADGKTREAALANAEGMLKDWIETAKAIGRKIPRPSNSYDQKLPEGWIGQIHDLTSHQPPATSHQPPATSHQPPATSHQPPA